MKFDAAIRFHATESALIVLPRLPTRDFELTAALEWHTRDVAYRIA